MTLAREPKQNPVLSCPGSSLEGLGAQGWPSRDLESKTMIFYCVLQHLSSRPPISLQSGEGDMPQVCILMSVQSGRAAGRDPLHTSPVP